MPELPQIARDTLPAGYRLAPEIVEGRALPKGRLVWGGRRWERSSVADGFPCVERLSGFYAVPIDYRTRHGRVIGLRSITGPRWAMTERIIEGEPGRSGQHEREGRLIGTGTGATVRYFA